MNPANRGARDMHFTHTIDGAGAASHAEFDVVNPATGQPFARCPDASREDLDEAVASARRAFPAWSALPAQRRAEYVRAFAQALRERESELAPLLTREQGKPLAAAHAEFSSSASHIEALASIDIGPELARDNERGRVEYRYRALGVVGAITPWNFPVALAVWKIGHALYTGNTMVLKPSPYTPLTTLRIGEIARDVLPPGVLNVVAGGNALGAWMTGHPGIDKISFTGSGPTGKKVLAGAASNLKRVTLELGGNDAAIVLPDANPQAIAHGVFWGAFRNSGQVCKAIKRLYVHDSIYERTAQALAEIARTVKVGNGLEPGVELGPVQNGAQFDIVMSAIEDARRAGGRILAGGHALAGGGYFIAPTIVADVGPGTRLVDEEQFGPAVPLIRYRVVDEALSQANESRYGLSGSVWTSDVECGRELAARLDVGTAWVNEHGGADPHVPFGGAKESGIGRENSILGLRDYMQLCVVQSPRP
jgi:acyl-CoA reductase-like NAD-dependent aldehyde dehydrogenase